MCHYWIESDKPLTILLCSCCLVSDQNVGGEESYFMTGISQTMHFKDSKFCLGNTHFSVLL